jgi:hypothetical protein
MLLFIIELTILTVTAHSNMKVNSCLEASEALPSPPPSKIEITPWFVSLIGADSIHNQQKATQDYYVSI